MEILDWQGRPVEAARTPTGVLAVVDYADNLIRVPGKPWPSAAVVQKLYKGRHTGAYAEKVPELTTKLGYYSDLQSLHSEDALTWSFFGPLTYQAPAEQAAFLNWLLERLELEADNSLCEVGLFRRIPHPDKQSMGGPENDFAIIGDRCVVLGEAKWRSPVGTRQGVNKDSDQISLRLQFLSQRGRRIFGDRRFVVLGMWRSLDDAIPAEAPEGVRYASLTWADLCEYERHPLASEFRAYLAWKDKHSHG